MTAALLEHREGVAGAAAGCKHRVGDDDKTFVDVFWKLAIVFYWFMSLLVAVKTDVADLGHRHKRLESVDHSHSCTEYRYDGEFAPCDFLGSHLADGSLYFNIFERQVAGYLVAHQEGDFFEKFTEILGTGFFLAHDRQLMLDHGVVDNV